MTFPNMIRSAFITTAFIAFCPLSFAFPYDDNLSNLPVNLDIDGIESRTDGTVRTYNIAITQWPDELSFSILGGDGGRGKGTTIFADQGADGGGGALVSGKFKIHPSDANALRPGGEIRFVVGSKGQDSTKPQASAGGGGGGTAILYRDPTDGANWELLAVAGGGGGGAANTAALDTYEREGKNGSTDTAGGDGRSKNNGGTNGGAGGRVLMGTEYGGGGGGLSNGRTYAVDGGGGNSSGGVGGHTDSGAGDGGFGFGGGGAAVRYKFGSDYGLVGGGGGGYSGGGAGEDGGGGGGGSYLDSRALNPSFTERASEKANGSVSYWAIPKADNIALPAPTIELNGSDPLHFYTYQTIEDPGADGIDTYGNVFAASPSGFPPTGSPVGTYSCDYTATDQFGASTTVTRTIIITQANKPVFDIPASTSGDFNSGENTQAGFATNIDAMDEDQTVLSFDVDNDNNALFQVQPEISADGTLTFTPAAGASGSAEVTVIAVDSPDDATYGYSDPKTFILTINPPKPPTGLSLSNTSVGENEEFVGIASAVDPFDYEIDYSLIGGADQNKFTIDPIDGSLSFNSVPDFENPHDANGDNIYEIVIKARGYEDSTFLSVSVVVTNVNETPGTPGIDTLSIDENTTAIGNIAAVDPDGDTLTYRIAGGADASRFAINSSTGALRFKSKQNFESPSDADKDGIYLLNVVASDGSLDSPAASFAITLLDIQEAPTNPGIIAFNTSEGESFVGEIEVEDPEGSSVSYTITGGVDAAFFTIDPASGLLEFLTAPDYEAPQDANANNGYLIVITASDGELSTELDVFVEVRDRAEAPTDILVDGLNVDVLSLAEDASPGQLIATLSAEDQDATNDYAWQLTDDANGLFILDGNLLKVASGASFDFETLNHYSIEIRVIEYRSGSLTQPFTIQITDVEEPEIEEFRTLYGLNPDGSDDGLDWSNNGIANLLYLAFGLGDPNVVEVDRSRLPSSKEGNEAGTFEYCYLRPKDGDGSIQVSVSTSADLIEWESPDDPEATHLPMITEITDLGDGYEKVKLTFSIPTGSDRFYRLVVDEAHGF